LSWPATTPPSTSSATATSPATGRIAAGYEHTCALTSSGGVRCWGSNEAGQLGDGTTTDRSVPVDVAGLASEVIAIDAGAQHTCALTSGGAVKCWGANNAGQLGVGTTSDAAVPLPVDVSGLASGVSAIAAGGSHTCVVMDAGGVKCWGYNAYGQLGTASTTDSSVPVDVSGLASGVSAIAAGDIHTCALTSARGVKCWGYGGSGGLSGGITSDSLVPVDITGLESRISAITAAYEQTCALATGGAVKCWGRNYSGQLGDGTTTERSTPVDVAGLGSGISAISAGFAGHTCALTSIGGVKCWGGSNGSVPMDLAGLQNGVTAIEAGGRHTCALTSGGAVKCWGDNWYGQLGNGRPCSSWSGSSVPVDVDFAVPTSGIEPTGTPIEPIVHVTGPREVVLRFDRGPDVAVGDLVGELFQPGPEFTLYGDGTVIFRNELAQLPPAEGPIIRARPFMIAHLDEDQIQSLLRYALGEGGLGDACERYETQDSDVAGSDVFTIHAGGLDKRVENLGSGPFGALTEYLRNFDRSGIPTNVFVADRYWGNLLDASVFRYIGDGLVPGLAETGTVPWPWPGVAPAEFVGLAELGPGRRVMSADEAAVLSLSDNGGVAQRVYLLGPDGETIYYFSLWPMLPDETG
jgi:alpha-tubulin suppressor-like RCC1 family protein